MWKRTRLLHILRLISSLFFLSNFQKSKNFISLVSRTERHTKLNLGLPMDIGLMHHVSLNQAAGAYLIPLFLLIFFLSNSKTLNVCYTFLWGLQNWTSYSHEQWVDLLCTQKIKQSVTPVKPLSDCHDISGDMRRYKASYNSAYIAADGHDLLLKIFGQIILRVPHDMSTIFLAK